jgi:phosphopantothenoylcysteine decarboxylase/phosphopantothenate--cysteine ligase
MGYALAKAAARHGRVTLVSGPVALKPPAGIAVVSVTTAAEMACEVFRRYRQADVVIMAAAVCDFRPKSPAQRKIKKQKFSRKLELVPTTDILDELGHRKRRQILVGFAAETDHLERNALDKLRRKNLDLIVANDARAFESDTSRAVIFGRGTREQLREMSKAKLARAIVYRSLRLMASKRESLRRFSRSGSLLSQRASS